MATDGPISLRIREVARVRRLAYATEQAYVGWARRFWEYSGRRDVTVLGVNEVRDFLTYLATERHVSASTQNQALNALVFIFERVFDRPLGNLGAVMRASRPKRLPTVLTVNEVRRPLEAMEGESGLLARLLYGSGLRVLEGCQLRVKDIDLSIGRITVRNGKGDKDRITMLPTTLQVPIEGHLQDMRRRFEADRAAGAPGVSQERP